MGFVGGFTRWMSSLNRLHSGRTRGSSAKLRNTPAGAAQLAAASRLAAAKHLSVCGKCKKGLVLVSPSKKFFFFSTCYTLHAPQFLRRMRFTARPLLPSPSSSVGTDTAGRAVTADVRAKHWSMSEESRYSGVWCRMMLHPRLWTAWPLTGTSWAATNDRIIHRLSKLGGGGCKALHDQIFNASLCLFKIWTRDRLQRKTETNS